MPRAKFVKCKGCGKRFKKSELSRAGYCKYCRLNHMLKVIKQLHEKRGYYYRKWKKNWEEGIMKALEKGLGSRRRS